MILKYTIDEKTSGKLVKQILKDNLKLSGKLITRLKFADKILCNNIPVHINHIVSLGDTVEAHINFEEQADDIIPQDIRIEIIFEDDCIVAVNKQPNTVVHPTFNHPSGTIANALMYHLKNKGLSIKIRPVSRLDRGTSGIIIFAKNQFVQENLIQQMNVKTFAKEYLGVVHGFLQNDTGTINLPIDRKPGSIMLRHVTDTGYPSITHYEVQERLNNASLVRFSLETGRTHQIRVHCQAIGHPLYGDTLYSDIQTSYIERQALHSQKVSFLHPISNTPLELSSPLPDDIKNLLEILRK